MNPRIHRGLNFSKKYSEKYEEGHIFAIFFKSVSVELYNSGFDRMTDELDIDNILRSVRRINIMMSIMMDKQQQVLTKYLPNSLLILQPESK